MNNPDQAADSAADQVIRQLFGVHIDRSESQQRAGRSVWVGRDRPWQCLLARADFFLGAQRMP